MTVLLCSVFSILRYKEHKPYFHRNILYLTWTESSNPQLFRTGTSCNMKHAQRIVKTKLHDHPSLLPSNISPTAFDTLISFCLDNSYFEYNNKFFAQNSGGPMGSPLTVEPAEIRVTEL